MLFLSPLFYNTYPKVQRMVDAYPAIVADPESIQMNAYQELKGKRDAHEQTCQMFPIV